MSIQIRKSTYRGVEGFKVCGKKPGQVGGHAVSIFTETRESAEHIAAKVTRGMDIELSDFTYGRLGG